MANIKTITLTGAVADDNGISTAQTTAGAGNLTITGALASGGVATLTPAGRVSFNSSGNIASVIFTITGTDRYGFAQTATVTGINNSTVATTVDFLTVTQIAADSAVGTNVIVGTNGVNSSAWYPGDYRTGRVPIISVSLSSGAVLTYTVEFTTTNLNDNSLEIGARISAAQTAIAFPSTDMDVVGASANQATHFVGGMAAFRVTIDTFTSGTLTTKTSSPNNSVV